MKKSEVTDFILEVRVGLLGVELESEEQMLPFVIHILSNKQETPTIIHAESEILLKTADKKEQEDNRWMVRLYIYTYIYSPDTDIQFCWKQSEDTRSSLTINSGLLKRAGCLVCSVIL